MIHSSLLEIYSVFKGNAIVAWKEAKNAKKAKDAKVGQILGRDVRSKLGGG